MGKQSAKEKIIKLEVSQRISDIEACYARLYKENEFDLLLNTNLKGRTLGSYASLIQFISTWSRVSTGKLRTYISKMSDANVQLTNLCNEFHGVVGLYMASNTDIVNRNGDFSVKKNAEEVLQNKLSIYKEANTKFRASYEQRNKGTMLACFDHTLCEFPPYFYDHIVSNSKYKIHSESSFRLLIQSILKVLSRVELSKIKNSYSQQYKDDIHEKLGTVAKELIENTEWWAKSMFNSRKHYNPNIRGMLIQLDTTEWNKEIIYKKDPMDMYISQIKGESIEENTQTGRQNSLGFFELSIFDSGPGMARRWSGKDFSEMTIQEEYEAVLTCLQENTSSDESAISAMRGLGLPNVLKTIGARGFLRLRTGRLNLFRNFAQIQLDETTEIKQRKFRFFNWDSKDEKASQTPIAEGCLFTIVYPFSY